MNMKGVSNKLLERYKKNCNILGIAICFLFGSFHTFGRYMYFDHNLPDNSEGWARVGIEIVLCTLIMWLLIPIIEMVSAFFIVGKRNDKSDFYKQKNSAKKFFLISIFLIALCWAPWIISFYPSSAEFDTYRPLMGYMGYMGWYDVCPRFYTCLFGYFYKWGLVRGNKELGVFLFVLLRSIVNILIFSYIVNIIFVNINKIVGSGALLFYAITPVWGAYSKHIFKDTSYLAFFAWYICETVLIVDELKKGKLTVWRCVLYSFSGLAVSLFRDNGIYVVLPITICVGVVIYWFMRRGSRVVFVLLGVLAFFAYQHYSFDIIEKEAKINENLFSIPFQQVARTVVEYGGELSTEERDIIDKVQGIETLPQRYDMLLLDPVRVEFESAEMRNKYLRNWFFMFFKYPQTYLEAFVGQTYGYYSFTPREAYHAGNFNCGMTIWHWAKDDRFPPEVTWDHALNRFEKARDALAYWADIWDTIPVLNITNSMPAYTWLIVLVGYYMIKRKRWIYCIPVFAMLLMILSCIMSPVNGCFRYYCGVAAAFPTMILLLKFSNRGEEV